MTRQSDESWLESVGGLIPFIAALQQVHGFATRTTAKAKALAAGAKAGPLRDQLDAVEPLSAFGVPAAGVALRARGARWAAGLTAVRAGVLAAVLATARTGFLAAGLAAVLAAVFEGVFAEGLCDSF